MYRPPLDVHSCPPTAGPEPGPVVGTDVVVSQLAWVSGSGAGPWQASVFRPPSSLSWLPSLEGPTRLSLPALPEIVSIPRPPSRVSLPVPPVIVSLPSP